MPEIRIKVLGYILFIGDLKMRKTKEQKEIAVKGIYRMKVQR